MQTVQCPNCCYRLEVDPNATSVRCDCCDSSFPVDRLLAKTGAAAGASTPDAAAVSVAQLIDSPDAGLVYIQNRFDNTDWEAYAEGTEIIIADIDEMVEKSKIKFGATASAWILDFESVAFPLGKKLEGLKKMAEKMAEEHVDPEANTSLATFDLYRAIVDIVIAKKDALIKRLENAVKYAEKFEPDKAAFAKMQETLESLKAALEALKPVKNIYDVPEVRAAQDKLDAEKVKEFAARGISVKEVYADACDIMTRDTFDRNDLLRRLESIRGYSDVNAKIDELNRYYDFNSEYYNFCGRSFIFKSKAKDPLFDPTAKSNDKKADKKNADPNEEAVYTGPVLQLFEVVNGKPEKKPLIDDISNIITVYGTRLYYVKMDKAICYYDIDTKRSFTLDRGKVGDYVFGDKYFTNATETAFYVRKRLPIEVLKKGCFAKLFKKQDEAIERRNNYSLLEVSLISDFSQTKIKELVDITEICGNNVFYTKADELNLEEIMAAKKKAAKDAPPTNTEEEEDEEAIKLAFRVFNTSTGEDREILNDNCAIHTVVEGKVVFSRYSPNAYNIDLFTFDPVENKETLIEANIYDFEWYRQGRLFYTVGNDSFCPLFSNNLKGTDRFEVMSKVENIVSVLAGWMYIIKRIAGRPSLVRVSTDGKIRQVVCLDLGSVIKVTDLYLYYIDTSNSLRVARTDGKEQVLIADNISAGSVIVDKDYIYYLREELVDRKIKAASLYRMDMDGHNVRKVLFDVSAIDDFDADHIIVKREERALFEITIPVDAKKTKTEKQDRLLTHYCKYNKHTGDIEVLLTLGLPDENEYEFRGCFGLGKKKKFNSSYKQLPKKITYKRANVAKAGSIFSEQASEQGIAAINPLEKFSKNNTGCGKGCSAPRKR